MAHLSDPWVIPLLAFLADWSIRWGVVLAALAVWFALRPPRAAGSRYVVCLGALAVGLLLPVVPRWGNAIIPWSLPGAPVAARTTAFVAPESRPEDGRTGAVRLPDATARGTRRPPVDRTPLAENSLATNPANHIRKASAMADTGRVASLVTACVWSAVVVVMLLRLAGAWWVLGRLRRGAVETNWRADPLLGECREAVRLTRDVGIAAHPSVSSPVVVGGFRPVVLVPPDWAAWPESHRRACLVHELTHLARYDDWAKVVQELVRAPLFFHPLVRWLLARLDRERELICDEAAVATGLDPIAYARVLLELARRPGRLFPDTSSLTPGWLPFLDRKTIGVRIERLLEEDMQRPLTSPSSIRSFVLGSLAAAAGLAIGGIQLHASAAGPTEPPAKSETARESPKREETPATPPLTAPAVAGDANRDIRWDVVDSDGNPVRGATVVAGVRDSGPSGRRVLTTDNEGRVTWALPAGTDPLDLVIYKEGFAVVMTSISGRTVREEKHRANRLGKPDAFRAVLVDGEGNPVAGAKVSVETVAYASEQKHDVGATLSTIFYRVPRVLIQGTSIEPSFSTVTDADGAFTFMSVQAGAGLKLAVVTADGRAMRVNAEAMAEGIVRRNLHDQGYVTAPPGAMTRLVAIPEARVAGRIISSVPGVSVSGFTASYQSSRQPGTYSPSKNTHAQVKTNAEGQFVLDGLSKGTVNVFVHGDGENQNWTYRAAEYVRLTPDETSHVLLELIPGIEVEGTVVSEGTRTPVEGAKVGVHGPSRPRSSAATTTAETDARGRYRFRLPSGETYFYITTPPAGFTRLTSDGSSRLVTIPDGVSQFTVKPIELARAHLTQVLGKVVDAAGTPVPDATVVGITKGYSCDFLDKKKIISDAQGLFRLLPSLEHTAELRQGAKLLIRLQGGAEHTVAVALANDRDLVVKLPVTAEIHKDADTPAK